MAMMSSKRSGCSLRKHVAHARHLRAGTRRGVAALQAARRSGGSSSGSRARSSSMPRRRKQLARGRDHGQGLQPEKVELHEARGFDPFHVELGRRQLGARSR